MPLIPWNPSPERNLERAWRDFDRLFTEELRPLGAVIGQGIPSMEVLDAGTEIVVRAELPGIDPKDVEVRVTDESLTLRGERKAEVEDRNKRYYHTERHYGSFVRTIPFPESVQAGAAQASFQNGVLEVRAPKRSPEEGQGGHRLDITTH